MTKKPPNLRHLVILCHVMLHYGMLGEMSCLVMLYDITLFLIMQMSVWVKDSGDWKALLHVIIQGLRHLLTYDSAWHLVIRIYAIHLSDEVRECGGFCQRVLWTRYGSGVLYFCLHPISWNSTTWCQLTMTVDWNVGQLWVPGKIRLDEDIAFSLPRWPFCSSNIHFTVSLHVEQTPFLRETTQSSSTYWSQFKVQDFWMILKSWCGFSWSRTWICYFLSTSNSQSEKGKGWP